MQSATEPGARLAIGAVGKRTAMSAESRDALLAEAFGACPDDVVTVLASMTDVLTWTEEIFRIIEGLTAGEIDALKASRIQTLAGLGNYLGEHFSNLADEHHRRMQAGLVATGYFSPPVDTDQ